MSTGLEAFDELADALRDLFRVMVDLFRVMVKEARFDRIVAWLATKLGDRG